MMAGQTMLARLVPSALLILTGYSLFIGCGPAARDAPPGVDETVFENEAEAIYLRNAGDDGNGPNCLVEPGEVEVEVVFTSCGSDCSTLEDGECTASVDGDQIEVTSYGRIVPQQPANRACPDVCAVMSVRCELGELEEGTYTIAHGASTRTTTLPGDDEFCF